MNKKGLLMLIPMILGICIIGGLVRRSSLLGEELAYYVSNLEKITEENLDLAQLMEAMDESKYGITHQLETTEQLKSETLELVSVLQEEIRGLQEEIEDLKKLYADKQASSGLLAISEEDRVLLAQLIYSEARGEPFKGKQAVANVVFNRINDDRFPDTVRETIHEPRQFVEAAILHLYPVTDEALEAIDQALKDDVTGGAFFFWAPQIATNRWLESRPVLTQIGGHEFLR